MITVTIGILCIAAIFKVRKILCRPRNIFIDGESRVSRPLAMSRLKAQMPDAEVEQSVSAYLYPEER